MSRIYLSPPQMGARDRALLLEAFDSNWIAPLGPQLDMFEREICEIVGVSDAVALSSGTAGLHLALMLNGVSRGDEVLLSTFTFIATANAVAYLGGVPVFIDSDRRTWNMDPGLLSEELDACARRGKLPKAVIAVDLYGQSADYDPIGEACARYDVPLIEDAAEALGATYKGASVGSFGNMAVFSFNGNKIITASGGGMLASDDTAMVRRARFLATQARDPAPHYQHSEIGFNYRMSNLLAAIGRGQLSNLEERVSRRREIFEIYRKEFGNMPGLEFMPEAPYGRSTRWLTCVTMDPGAFGVCREDVRKALEEEDIESRPVWKPMHLQPVYRDCRVRGGAVAEEIFRNGLCLPSGGSLTEEDLARIVATVRKTRRISGC